MSKKRILNGIFALALLVTIGFGVQKSLKSDFELNNLALMNVEALADGESGSGISGRCTGTSTNKCDWRCPSCNRLWESQSTGLYLESISGTCLCGHSV